jgi:hypothetical protein
VQCAEYRGRIKVLANINQFCDLTPIIGPSSLRTAL